MNMKFKAMLLGLSVITALPAFAQKPVYLDTGKPIEERVKDALNRMTLEEKVKMIHLVRQAFPASEFPKYGLPTVLMVSVRKCCGMNGIRLDGQTIPVLPIRH
jgi:beta-glucosidase